MMLSLPQTTDAQPPAKRARREAPRFGSVTRAGMFVHELLSPNEDPYERQGDMPFVVSLEKGVAAAAWLVANPRVPDNLAQARLLLQQPGATAELVKKANRHLHTALNLLGMPLLEGQTELCHMAAARVDPGPALAALLEDGLVEAIHRLEAAVIKTASRCPY